MKLANGGRYHVSLLDTDLYKLTMQNAICRLYPNAIVRYEFILRSNRDFPPNFVKVLKEIIDSYRDLRLQPIEKLYLKDKIRFLPSMYLDFLEGYRYDPTEIVTLEQLDRDIKIVIEGYWYRTVLWEVPLMATISELFFEMTGVTKTFPDLENLDAAKFQGLSEIGVLTSDFGTRRRYSYSNHARVVENMTRNLTCLNGTSNVHLAQLNDITARGTHAHEWHMYHGACYGYRMATSMALDAWVQVYQGDLGIALTDTYTTNVFFKAFTTKQAKLWDGVRQDSGDIKEFAIQTINHYRGLGINPQHKNIIFSNGINSLGTVQEIKDVCGDDIRPGNGIGTWISCDIPGVDPMNMVIKMTGVFIDGHWVGTVKLSDDQGKNTGKENDVRLCKQVLNVP